MTIDSAKTLGQGNGTKWTSRNIYCNSLQQRRTATMMDCDRHYDSGIG